MTPEQAKALLAKGLISKETYKDVLAKINEPVLRHPAIDTVEQHQETPEERTQRFLQKSKPAPPKPTTYAGVHEAITNHPLIKQMDEKLKELQSNPTVDKANKATESGIEKFRGGIQSISDKITDAVAPGRKKEESQADPIYIGDIDEPVREPVKQEREFSNEADREEYLKNKLKEKKQW